jgi:hypothetical protein
MGVHKVSAFHPFIFQKSEKSTIIRNLAVSRHFVSYLVFFSSIRVDPGPYIVTSPENTYPVANTGKLRSIGQMPVEKTTGLPQVTDKRYHIMLYTPPCGRVSNPHHQW